MNLRTQIPPLNDDQFSDALEALDKLLAKQLSQLREQDQITVNTWIGHTVALIQPVFSLRMDYLQTLMGEVVQDTVLQEFMMELTYRFFCVLGIANGASRLAANIAEGMMIDGPDLKQNILPDTLKTNMALTCLDELIEPEPWWRRIFQREPTTLVSFLANNRLLLVIYLLNLREAYTPAPPAQA